MRAASLQPSGLKHEAFSSGQRMQAFSDPAQLLVITSQRGVTIRFPLSG
ncbi:hypothetical protein [Dasania marina]|nr:hypothetical protein [Dasania marina]